MTTAPQSKHILSSLVQSLPPHYPLQTMRTCPGERPHKTPLWLAGWLATTPPPPPLLLLLLAVMVPLLLLLLPLLLLLLFAQQLGQSHIGHLGPPVTPQQHVLHPHASTPQAARALKAYVSLPEAQLYTSSDINQLSTPAGSLQFQQF